MADIVSIILIITLIGYILNKLHLLYIALAICLIIVIFNVYMVLANQNDFMYCTPADINERSLDVQRRYGEVIEEYNLPYTEIYVETKDNCKLSCYFIKQNPDIVHKCHTVIYFHGNAGTLLQSLPLYHDLYYKHKCNILAVDYRGFGNSTGTPYEEGLKIDADAIMAYINTCADIDNTKIILFGHSVGSAVCVYIASQLNYNISGIVLNNTFLSIPKVVLSLAHLPNIFTSLLYKLSINQWNNELYINQIKCPILMISTSNDEIVPSFHRDVLYQQIIMNPNYDKNKIIFQTLLNGGHNDAFEENTDIYNQKLEDFFQLIKNTK